MIHFLANLGDDNAADLAQDIGARDTVLLSTLGAAGRTLYTARAIKARQVSMAADSGNFSNCRRIRHAPGRAKAATGVGNTSHDGLDSRA